MKHRLIQMSVILILATGFVSDQIMWRVYANDKRIAKRLKQRVIRTKPFKE